VTSADKFTNFVTGTLGRQLFTNIDFSKIEDIEDIPDTEENDEYIFLRNIIPIGKLRFR